MALIVNLDLVIPAVIESEMLFMSGLKLYEENRDCCLNGMTISVDQVINFAVRMKSRDFGRVVINFNREDVVRYFESNPNIFKPIFSSDQNTIYTFIIPKNVDKEEYFISFIKECCSHINYDNDVLRTLGLFWDKPAEEVELTRNKKLTEKSEV